MVGNDLGRSLRSFSRMRVYCNNSEIANMAQQPGTTTANRLQHTGTEQLIPVSAGVHKADIASVNTGCNCLKSVLWLVADGMCVAVLQTSSTCLRCSCPSFCCTQTPQTL